MNIGIQRHGADWPKSGPPAHAARSVVNIRDHVKKEIQEKMNRLKGTTL